MSDDKIAEIKERHFHDERWRNGPSMGFETICPQTHDDREWLLAEVDRLRAEIARMQELMRGISINMVDLIEQLTRDRDTLLAEVDRLRARIEKLEGESNA
jgi:hypothetical protein